MNKLPLARTTDIVVQTLGKEVLIYDLYTHKAYNLNETSSVVYQACDGKTTLGDLKARTNFTDEIIFLAIDKLQKENLLEKSSSFAPPLNGISRREAIRRAGLTSMIALPVISSLVAPTAAMAQSAFACPVGEETCGAVGCCPIGFCAADVTCCSTFSPGSLVCGSTCCPPGFFCSGGACMEIPIGDPPLVR